MRLIIQKGKDLGDLCVILSDLSVKTGFRIRILVFPVKSPSDSVILSELRVPLSGLCVKPVLNTIQPNFNAEIAEADAEIAKKQLIINADR